MFKKKKTIVILAFVVIILIAAGVYFVFSHYYDLLNTQSDSIGFTGDPQLVYEDIETDATDDANSSEELTPEEIEEIDKRLEENLLAMADSDMADEDIFNILVIGVDSRNRDFVGRSDSMILVTINKKNQRILMTSFLRDSYVSISGYENNRLNAAYAFGGTDLLLETINNNFGISVDRCVIVNFFLVMDIIDLVGGIDVNINASDINAINRSIKEANYLLDVDRTLDLLDESNVGLTHLNGKQALAYARNRSYSNGDFTRTAHQREVLLLLYEKVKDLGLLELNEMAEVVFPQVSTDLSKGDCIYLLSLLLQVNNYSIENFSIPVDDTWEYAQIRGMAVVTMDLQANAEYWKQQVYGTGSSDDE